MRRPPHPALTRHAAYLAFELAASLRGAVDRELRELGMTWPDYAVLAITDALEGPSEEAISNRAGVDRGSAACSHRPAQDPLFRRSDGPAAAAAAAGAVDEAFRTTLRRLHARERARLHVLMARAMG
jgi:hypothetical protein